MNNRISLDKETPWEKETGNEQTNFRFNIITILVYIIGIVYQAVILITVNGLNFTAVLVSYVNVIIYFAVDVIIVYLIALIYPRLMSLTKIEKDKSEKFSKVSENYRYVGFIGM